MENEIRPPSPGQVNAQAFSSVMAIYLKSQHAQPLASQLARLDRTVQSAYRQRTPDVSILVCDVEIAVKRALGSDAALVQVFHELYDDIDDLADVPPMDAVTARLHGRLEQKIGREFRHRGLWPLSKYFGIVPRDRWAALRASA